MGVHRSVVVGLGVASKIAKRCNAESPSYGERSRKNNPTWRPDGTQIATKEPTACGEGGPIRRPMLRPSAPHLRGGRPIRRRFQVLVSM